MTPAPAVTVLIATYNSSDTLRCAVESVLWQTWRDFELWVIGDGCTDDSAAVVADYARADARVHWHNLPVNTGYQSEPHNEGLRRARGRYVAYLNHDDLWLPTHLELLVAALDRGADAAYSILEWKPGWRAPYPDIPRYPHAPLPPEASATMHRRDLVDTIGYWKLPHEIRAIPRADFFRRAAFAGKRFELVPRLTVIKFGRAGGAYGDGVRQRAEMERIRSDPELAHAEIAALLVQAQQDLERLPSARRLRSQVANAVRRRLVRAGIDPARLVFWRRRGWHLRIWRHAHELPDGE